MGLRTSSGAWNTKEFPAEITNGYCYVCNQLSLPYILNNFWWDATALTSARRTLESIFIGFSDWVETTLLIWLSREGREERCKRCSWCETKAATTLRRSRERQEVKQGTQTEAGATREIQAEAGVGSDTEMKLVFSLFHFDVRQYKYKYKYRRRSRARHWV